MSKKINNFLRACIPHNILLDLDLSANEMRLYGLIETMEANTGNVFYSNRKLAEIFKVSERAIGHMRKKLCDKNYITRTWNAELKKYCWKIVRGTVFIDDDLDEGVEVQLPGKVEVQLPPQDGSTASTLNKGSKKVIPKDNNYVCGKDIVINGIEEIPQPKTHTQTPNLEKLKQECLTNEKCLSVFNAKFADKDITIAEMHEECVAYYMLENKFVSWHRFLAWIRNEKPHSHLFKPTEPLVTPEPNNNPSAIEKREIEIAQEYKHALNYPKFMDIYFPTEESKQAARLIYEKLGTEAEKQKSKPGVKPIGKIFNDVMAALKTIGNTGGCPA